MESCLVRYSPELWNLLPYAGLWYPVPSLPKVEDLKLPEETEVTLLGIPYEGTNTGQNPDLRLINFTYLSSLKGPVREAGVQTLFSHAYLNYKIKWRVEPLSKFKGPVKIGFYTSAYLAEGRSIRTCMLMLSNKGPAIFTASGSTRKGCFEAEWLGDMYVVVDANVSVKLSIEVSKPKQIINPDLSKLFKPYKYIINDECVATDQLVSLVSFQTLLRPQGKYIKISEEMINYLIDTGVNVTLFDSVSPSLNRLTTETDRIVYDIGNVEFEYVEFPSGLLTFYADPVKKYSVENQPYTFLFEPGLNNTKIKITLTLDVVFGDPDKGSSAEFALNYSLWGIFITPNGKGDLSYGTIRGGPRGTLLLNTKQSYEFTIGYTAFPRFFVRVDIKESSQEPPIGYTSLSDFIEKTMKVSASKFQVTYGDISIYTND